jgi:tRNA uridine 5-carboxymethylaminomethyl modification enzyme
VQTELVHSIKGLENAKIRVFGYGIEHGVVEPTQLYPTLETKIVRNLYMAGQINGTTGYEEAGAQGLVAGINAALKAKDKDPLILDRSSSYIGVLIDDLTTKGTNEPYRMFTSRVEYRLLLREDNACPRLSRIGFEAGLLNQEKYRRVLEAQSSIEEGRRYLRNMRIKPDKLINGWLEKIGSSALKKDTTLEELLKRPQVGYADLLGIGGCCLDIPESSLRSIEIEVKYSGFIDRQLKDVERFKNLEKIRLPEEIDYQKIQSLSKEIREKLQKFKPINLGQASRISGVTPAAISLLMVYLKKYGHKK